MVSLPIARFSSDSSNKIHI